MVLIPPSIDHASSSPDLWVACRGGACTGINQYCYEVEEGCLGYDRSQKRSTYSSLGVEEKMLEQSLEESI